MTFLAWYCRRCGRILKTEPEGVYPRGCSCRVPVLPSGPTSVTFYPACRIYLHPALLARRAAEIAESQRGRIIGRDACGRPFVVAGADPLAEAPAAPPEERGRVALLIQTIRALRWPVRPSVGRPVGRAR
jgi:hypothetical protein